MYDSVGNVTKIVDGVNSETVDYTYDDLDRLLTASVPTGESLRLRHHRQYDQQGRRRPRLRDDVSQARGQVPRQYYLHL